MVKQLFTNNASTEIVGAITDSATSITVNTGRGDLFASPTGGDYQLATLYSSTAVEIIKITAKSGDVLTVARGQEGTTAIAWASFTSIEGRATKGTLERFLQNPTTAAAAGANGIAIGESSSASADDSISIGTDSDVQGAGSVAVGKGAATFAANEVSIGDTSQAQGVSSISIGYLSDTYNAYDIAIGHNAQVSNLNATGVGKNAIASQDDAIGIGTDVVAASGNAIAIGHLARSNTGNSVAVGYKANNPDSGATPAAWAATTAYTIGNVRLITGIRCRVVLAGTSGGSAPSVGSNNGDYFLDGTTTAGVVWMRDELIDSSIIAIGDGAYGKLAVGQGAKSINGVSLGDGTYTNDSSVALGTDAACPSKNSMALGSRAYNPQIDYSVAIGQLPILAHAPAWWFGDEYKEYVGFEGLLGSEFMDLTGGAAWTATAAARHGSIVRPVTPNGKQYSRWDNNYNIWKDPKLLHYTEGNTGGTEPTWPTTIGDSVTDGDGDWICIPHDGTYVMALPCDMLIEEVMFICYLSTGVTVQANISIGTTGNLTKVVNNQPTVGLTADKTVTKWVPAQPVIVSDITIKIDTLATGTKMWGRFVFKGFYTKYL